MFVRQNNLGPIDISGEIVTIRVIYGDAPYRVGGVRLRRLNGRRNVSFQHDLASDTIERVVLKVDARGIEAVAHL